MATVATTSKSVLGSVTPTQITVATSGDILTYAPNTAQELILVNSSASPVVVTLDGASGTTVAVPLTGGATFSVAAGYTVSVPANATTVVLLDSISNFLQGVVAITAATGAVIRASIIA